MIVGRADKIEDDKVISIDVLKIERKMNDAFSWQSRRI